MEGQVVGAHQQVPPPVAPHSVQRTIQKKRLHVCEVCKLGFASSGALVVHKRMHAESPPRRVYKRTTGTMPEFLKTFLLVPQASQARARNWLLHERETLQEE